MSTQYQKLSDLLKQLFQSDQADLDFGIYRIINQRRAEINKFLDEDLLPQVQAAFSKFQSADTKVLEAELQKATEDAEALGVVPDSAPKVQKIRERMATYSVDVNDLENQVYSALYNFFRRYYDEGDFISQRRYKEGVYAIPYEGEEVKLYWANHDQYYIKTSEYFRDYSFKLPWGKRAHFKLVEADTEKDNRKEIDDNKRRFVLAEEPLAWQDGEVVIRFEFRPEKAKQSNCNEHTLETIFGWRKNLTEQIQKDALTELAHPAPTEGNPDRTLLEKHLEGYTRRNTQDYFIHKDLGKFLRRELDFYIKNEVMHLDNIENESAPWVEEYLSKIKVIRQIAHKIIDFLAQIEDFQKKLWLKKKFVVETHYCITLDRIPEELYPEIAANDAQREEWVRLFTINKIKKDLVTAEYSDPLTVEFLKANPFLVLDTKFFDQGFKYKVLASTKNINQAWDGLLVHGENFQALNLLKGHYEQSVKLIYADPPYNAPGTSEILYKNNFLHSSWLTLMDNRLEIASTLLSNRGTSVIAIDENEFENLVKLIKYRFINYLVQVIAIVHNPSGIQGENFSVSNDFAIFAHPDIRGIIGREIRENNADIRNFRDVTGDSSLRNSAKTCFYPIFVKEGKIVGFGEVLDDGKHPEEVNEVNNEGIIAVYPIDPQGVERKWRFSRDTVENIEDQLFAHYISHRDVWDIKRKKNEFRFKTVWSDSKYSSNNHGTQVLNNILGKGKFNYPKSIYTMMDTIRAGLSEEVGGTVIDYFAGSGTTGHAVINLNREDKGNRKYVLIEMGQYFNTATKPRIQKVIYSKDWNNGKPVSRKGSSHAFKYLRLESYEDTLNNVKLKRPDAAQSALLDETAFSEDYLLHYMLDFESQGSLLDLKRFDTPFNYQLEIASSTVGETEATPVDLVETFNYLLGLHVQSIRKIEDAVVVRGTTRDEKQILIIWRTVSEMDSDLLNDFFETHLAGETQEITDIYVNGDNNLANIRPDDQHWTVHLTEESFHRLMFEG